MELFLLLVCLILGSYSLYVGLEIIGLCLFFGFFVFLFCFIMEKIYKKIESNVDNNKKQ